MCPQPDLRDQDRARFEKWAGPWVAPSLVAEVNLLKKFPEFEMEIRRSQEKPPRQGNLLQGRL